MRFFYIITAIILAAGSAYAGAWTQQKGDFKLITTGLYYSTGKYFNESGKLTHQQRYTKYELNPYMEYGLSDAITLGANLSLLQRADQGAYYNYGIGDSEIFARARIWQQGGYVVSVEPIIKFPGLEYYEQVPQIGSKHYDAGGGIYAGYGFKAYDLNHFVDLYAGYRYRFGYPEDQLKFSGTLGVSLSDDFMVMPQIFATYRTHNPKILAFTQSSGDDYNLVKLQISGVYRIRNGTSVQLGAFSHVDGRNVGDGDGVLISWWQRF